MSLAAAFGRATQPAGRVPELSCSSRKSTAHDQVVST